MSPSKVSIPFVRLCHALAVIAGVLFLLQRPAWADGAHPDPGHLQQTVLAILRFPPEGVAGEMTAAEENHIASELNAASDFLWTHSNQSLRVNFQSIKILQSLVASDYKTYGSSSAAMYNKTVDQALSHRNIVPGHFAGIVMIYRPTNAPGSLFYNTWIWYNDEISSNKAHPGFSSVLYSGLVPLSEFVVHEYLHQLDHRFEEANNPDPAQRGFMNPDDMTNTPGQQLAAALGTTFTTPVSYYQAILKHYIVPPKSLHAVNYRWLEGKRGVFRGGELNTLYDFAQADDVLNHISGDNIHSVHTVASPASFWFRAALHHTAAFGTQTGWGRHLLKEVAFNYEIAPGDYTFKVRLVYYDNRGNLVDERIDDGIYTLGRQIFSTNRKTITLATAREVEDFRIVFEKGNQLSGAAANDDWLLLGNIKLTASPAP